ncbi:asparagine synthase (glutamine-hydrolyzing) [Allopontixanthobacter sp.]|uniref:asparagine synthase (glutamine-hydrolyzing) n=1 Tax=Allopontixanthobacter sp. TaxID=2906452 RepID=UPI002ABB7336|nr:asparagine synthase (glutamine-hydrolyzing) [Allopontixanthobacter sp.]MDZ4307432.1 asparagine synthase (glutamine-hydrolyzing) [Allopontixanthobacter sp.]
MCGIAGIMSLGAASAEWPRQLAAMTDAIRLRGPDGEGAWINADEGIALGHRRLSIIDTSNAGHQPMTAQSGRYVITYNGEIYNFGELREALDAEHGHIHWRGHSDTEVLIEAISHWGVAHTLERATGMFGFALWDRKDRELTLARDRMGEKPLYYGWQGAGLAAVMLFGSDLAALEAHPSLDRSINPAAVEALTTFGYIPAPLSIYRSVRKLLPGSFVTFTHGGDRGGLAASYWSLAGELIASQSCEPLTGDEAVSELEAVLARAVKRQMVADVPLGAFLSGGVDSSTIVALMQAQSDRPVKTFTIGYAEKAYDESAAARGIARHLGTDHHEFIIGSSDALAVVPDLPHIYSEPFADSSQIPTYLISRYAREHVTVSLSGDGGDELLAGYNRYTLTSRAWSKLEKLPLALRKVLARSLTALPAPAINRAGTAFVPGKVRLLGDKLHKIGSVLDSETIEDVYARLLASGNTDGIDLRSILSQLPAGQALPAGWGPIRAMQLRDMLGYLPDDILTKVDRAGMANSLETRVPMLDPDVVRLTMRMPADTLIRDGAGKWPLRQVLARLVPENLTSGPKMGFGVPIDSWLRGPLRDWAESLLDSAESDLSEVVDMRRARKLWGEHLSGDSNRQHQLWPVLMLAGWKARS